jgi:hypothetical protein
VQYPAREDERSHRTQTSSSQLSGQKTFLRTTIVHESAFCSKHLLYYVIARKTGHKRQGKACRLFVPPHSSSCLFNYELKAYAYGAGGGDHTGRGNPPPAFINSPVTKDESSEARNSATPAISSGVPYLPKGTSL